MKILLVGLGNSNKLLLEEFKNEDVCIIDEQTIDDPRYVTVSYLQENLPLFDLGFISPAIPENSELAFLARYLCRNLSSEMNYGFSFLKKTQTVIGVTGTNGKTTTLMLLKHCLSSLSRKVYCLGNIGEPLFSRARELEDDAIVIIEISSFQAQYLNSIHMDYLIYTTFASNHLDKSYSLYSYFAAKKRLSHFADHIITSSSELQILTDVRDKVCYVEKIGGKYTKNKYYNELIPLVLKMCENLGVSLEVVTKSIESFSPPKYRQQRMKNIGNLVYINDSKSTSVESTMSAINNYAGEFQILILGGKIKSDLQTLIIPPKTIVFVYGSNAVEYAKYFPCHTFLTLTDAFEATLLHSDKIGYVIFSPSGSSLAFKNYEERGAFFEELVDGYRQKE